MKECNEKAGDMKGDERKAFMKKCLSGPAVNPQQQKMKDCNAEAGKKKLGGEDRKKFMSECLSK
jgi:truncated hemoglobin YjbI